MIRHRGHQRLHLCQLECDERLGVELTIQKPRCHAPGSLADEVIDGYIGGLVISEFSTSDDLSQNFGHLGKILP